MRRARLLLLLAALALTAAAAPAPAVATTATHPKLERLVLHLINCTRTGGWVREDGSCNGWGSGRYSAYRRPLKLSEGISDHVARPYARRIARADYCGHFYGDSTPRTRLRAAGYTSSTYGENVACGWGGGARSVIIRTHRSMQAEKSYGGGHWKNFKDRDYRRVGIGVAVVDGRVRIVEDFYRG